MTYISCSCRTEILDSCTTAQLFPTLQSVRPCAQLEIGRQGAFTPRKSANTMNRGFFNVFLSERLLLDINCVPLSLTLVCFLVGSKATSQPPTATSQEASCLSPPSPGVVSGPEPSSPLRPSRFQHAPSPTPPRLSLPHSPGPDVCSMALPQALSLQRST